MFHIHTEGLTQRKCGYNMLQKLAISSIQHVQYLRDFFECLPQKLSCEDVLFEVKNL